MNIQINNSAVSTTTTTAATATSKKHSAKQVKVYEVTELRSLTVVAKNKYQALEFATAHADVSCDSKCRWDIRIKKLRLGIEECETRGFDYIDAAGEFIPKQQPSK